MARGPVRPSDYHIIPIVTSLEPVSGRGYCPQCRQTRPTELGLPPTRSIDPGWAIRGSQSEDARPTTRFGRRGLSEPEGPSHAAMTENAATREGNFVMCRLAVIAALILILAFKVAPTRHAWSGASSPMITGSPTATPADHMPTGPHQSPAVRTFDGCDADGDDSDEEANLLKNRTATVGDDAWISINLQATFDLPLPVGTTKHMQNWLADAKATITPFIGVPVRTEGFVIDLHPSGGESTNCNLDETSPDAATDVDSDYAPFASNWKSSINQRSPGFVKYTKTGSGPSGGWFGSSCVT